MRILDEGFKPGDGDADWLGEGIYFWERAPAIAHDWAAVIHEGEACVVQAEVDLTDCFDLCGGRDNRLLKPYYARFEELIGLENVKALTQDDIRHELDHRVLSLAAAELEEQGRRIRVVRAPFLEGRPLYSVPGGPQSAFSERGQVQLAVRDATAISNCSIFEFES
jgi:hypothetical protein